MRGLFGTIAGGLERKATDISALTWAKLWGDDVSVKSGVSVNVDSALRVSTLLSATRVLAEGTAQLPFKLYRERDDGGADPARNHKLYRILWRRPNDWQTSFEFRETMMFHAVLCEGAYAFINRLDGEVRELIPLVPGRCKPVQGADYELTYELTDIRGGAIRRVPRSDIFSIRGPSWNGYSGLSIVQQAREALGLAIATEETHARLHSNAAQPGGILSVKGGLDEPARNRLKEQWLQFQGGMNNKFRTAVVDQDATWTPMQMKGVDAQHLETRKFQIEEICRALRVFPQMVGFSDKTATFASAEAFFIAHVIHSLGPWIERWEQSVARDLLRDDELDLFAKLSVQGLLRGDAKSRAEYYASGIVNGWLLRNEARRYEDLNPLDGLDVPLIPLNMGTQEERDALQSEVAKAVKSMMIGHNGGSALDDDTIETKISEVISTFNRERIAPSGRNLS